MTILLEKWHKKNKKMKKGGQKKMNEKKYHELKERLIKLDDKINFSVECEESRELDRVYCDYIYSGQSSFVQYAVKRFSDKYSYDHKHDSSFTQVDESMKNACEDFIKEFHKNKKMREKRISILGEISDEYYQKLCNEIFDLYEMATDIREEIENYEQERKKYYRKAQLESERVIKELDNINKSFKWSNMRDGSINDKDKKMICNDKEMFQKVFELLDKDTQTLNKTISDCVKNELDAEKEININNCAQEIEEISENTEEDISKKTEWMLYFWKGWLCRYIKSPFLFLGCYCTRTDKDREEKSLQSFIELCVSHEETKKGDNTYYINRIEEFGKVFYTETFYYNEDEKKIIYPKSAEIPLVLWFISRNILVQQIRSKLIKVMEGGKAGKIFTKSQGNDFVKDKIIDFTRIMLELKDNISQEHRYDVFGLNELFGVALVNVVVESLFRSKKLITKEMIISFEKKYPSLVGNLVHGVDIIKD